MILKIVQLDIDTVIPLGLITNEIITNSLKYAFKENTVNAMIKVKLKESKDDFKLIISDNGVGIDDSVFRTKRQQILWAAYDQCFC